MLKKTKKQKQESWIKAKSTTMLDKGAPEQELHLFSLATKPLTLCEDRQTVSSDLCLQALVRF